MVRHLREVGGDRRVGAEVRHEQRRGAPPADARKALAPQLEVDIGRRCRRQHEPVVPAPDACGIAHERHAAGGAVVAHVMRCVARRIRHVEIAAARRDALAAAQDGQSLRRHGKEFAPEPIHLVAPEARRARDELLRSDQVRCALLVDVHAQLRVLAHQRPRDARVIEVDVRQQNRAQIGDADARALELGAQRRQRAGRAGVDERDPAGAINDHGGDDARGAQEMQIEIRKSRSESDHVFARARARTTKKSTTTITRPTTPVRPIQRSRVSQLFASA